MKRKLLLVFGVVLGLLIIAGVVVYVSVRSWTFAAPSPIEGRSLAGSDTRFILLYTAEKKDTEAVELARFLAQLADDNDKVQQELKDLINRLGFDDIEDFVEQMLPIHAGVLVDRDQSSLAFVSFSKFANLITAGLDRKNKRQGQPAGEAGGVAIYQQDAKFSAIFENTLLSSRSRRRLESALNKLAAGTGPAPGLAVLGKLPRGSPVVAALIDDKRFLDELLAQSRDSKGRSLKGNLRRHLDIGARDFDWATLRGTLGIKVLSGQMQFGLAESTDPERMRDSVERLFLEFVRHFLNENLTFENKSKLVDHSIEVLFRLENLRSYWRKQLR